MANQVAKQGDTFVAQFEGYAPQIKAALPSHISVEKFQRVALTAVNQNPGLVAQNVDRKSLFLACVAAAQDGLFPDGREAALVVFGGKVQYMPMIGGIRKRMRNSGDVLSAEAHVVRENDKFAYVLGDNPRIEHEPALKNRGDEIAVYAIIRLKNGEILREVMSKEEIEKVRGISRASKNGPWVTWWGEMARKTVLRRCAKAAPNVADMDAMFQGDDALADATADPAPSRPVLNDYVDPDMDPDKEYQQAISGQMVVDENDPDITGEQVDEETGEVTNTESAGGPSDPGSDDGGGKRDSDAEPAARAVEQAAATAPVTNTEKKEPTKKTTAPAAKTDAVPHLEALDPSKVTMGIAKAWLDKVPAYVKTLDAASLAQFREENAQVLEEYDGLATGHAANEAINNRLAELD